MPGSHTPASNDPAGRASVSGSPPDGVELVASAPASGGAAPSAGAPAAVVPTGPTMRPSARPGGAASLIGTTIGGRYRIDSILGEGGMGTVYAAEHTLMRKRVALKVLHPDMSRIPDIVARFEREALAAGHIDHPNIAAATDFGQLADGSFFLVLELVVGEDLSDVVSHGPIAVARCVHIATQIASALARAHSLGVVHRDLKPDNVMLITRGADMDFVKVLDFGIAKVPVLEAGERQSTSPLSGPQKALTQAGMIYGTPAYMAPEQALGQPVDGRADLYAVGVLLFEMLTGKRPFHHENMATLLGLQVTAPVPRMAELAPDVTVPPAIEAVVRRLLAKDPQQRFATAEDLEAALAQSSAVTLPTDPALPEPTRPPSTDAPAVGNTAPIPLILRDGNASSPTQLLRRFWGLGAVVSVIVLSAVLLRHSDGPKATSVPAEGAASSPVPDTVPPSVATASAAPTTSAAPLAVPEPAPVDPLAAPLAVATAALAKNDPTTVLSTMRPLEAANATRPEVHRLLERAYAISHERVSALREADAWLANDPSAAADLALQSDVGEIATHPVNSDAAISLLAARMGAPGVDILYDLAYASKQKPSVASHAASVLAQPEVRSHAGPAAAVLLDLRAATTCEARHALLPRVKADGDRRALTLLKPWTAAKKESACMHHDAELTSAITAVSGRTGML